MWSAWELVSQERRRGTVEGSLPYRRQLSKRRVIEACRHKYEDKEKRTTIGQCGYVSCGGVMFNLLRSSNVLCMNVLYQQLR